MTTPTQTTLYPKTGLKAWIDLSTYCNAACPQCHRTSFEGTKQKWLPLVQWSLAEFKQAYPPEVLKHYDSFEFCGTWGDPIMNKDIYKIVEYLIENDPRVKVQINTNGSLRDPDWWWKLGMMARERLNVVWDVDGITQEMHERYRQGTELWRIKDNIEAYCTTPANADIITIVFLHNEDYIDDIRKMVREWGVMGNVFAQESNRFYRGPTFEFMSANGHRMMLEQTTQESENFSNVSVKDHRWRAKFDASGRNKKDL